MKSEAIIMTFDLGKDHFNAILINKQLKLISSNGSMINIPGNSDSKLSKGQDRFQLTCDPETVTGKM